MNTFREDLSEFYRLMGLKSFWRLSEFQHSQTLHGLMHSLARSEERRESQPFDSSALQAALLEYGFRKMYILANPKWLEDDHAAS